MIEGFFRIAFTGAKGSGFGILLLTQGAIVGADVGGAVYDGTYTENPATGDIDIKVTMAAPAGMTPVQTGVPLAAPISVPITATVSRNNLNSNSATLLQSPLGAVNVIFHKIRDIA